MELYYLVMKNLRGARRWKRRSKEPQKSSVS